MSPANIRRVVLDELELIYLYSFDSYLLSGYFSYNLQDSSNHFRIISTKNPKGTYRKTQKTGDIMSTKRISINQLNQKLLAISLPARVLIIIF
jgi:hypothetical protein